METPHGHERVTLNGQEVMTRAHAAMRAAADAHNDGAALVAALDSLGGLGCRDWHCVAAHLACVAARGWRRVAELEQAQRPPMRRPSWVQRAIRHG